MKVTLANMRSLGCHDLLVYCKNALRCWHRAKINADCWPDDTAIVDIEHLFVCTMCGSVGAELRPDFSPHTGQSRYAYGAHRAGSGVPPALR